MCNTTTYNIQFEDDDKHTVFLLFLSRVISPCVSASASAGGGASQIAIIYQATEAAALSPLLPPFGWLE